MSQGIAVLMHTLNIAKKRWLISTLTSSSIMNAFDCIHIIFNSNVSNMKMKVTTNAWFDCSMDSSVYEYSFWVVIHLATCRFDPYSNRLFSVGGGPRQVSLRETRLYAERHDSITLLCPIFSALPAWYTFVVPQPRVAGISALTGHDYLRLRNLSDLHSGVFTCRVTTSEADDGYSLTSTVHLDVFGKTTMLRAQSSTLLQVHLCVLNHIQTNTFRLRLRKKLSTFYTVQCVETPFRITTGSRVMFIRSRQKQSFGIKSTFASYRRKITYLTRNPS